MKDLAVALGPGLHAGIALPAVQSVALQHGRHIQVRVQRLSQYSTEFGSIFNCHARNRYDLVLMDVQMPVMGGFDATARIREREIAGAPHTPIVAMTAHAMKGDRERCIAAGMDGYLSKPVHAPDLVTVLNQLTGHDDPPPPPPHEPTLITGPVFEREQVLFNLGGDEELLEQLIQMYAEDEPRLVADIDTAIATRDAEALHNAAHALKGAVANFCATRAISPFPTPR